MEVGDPPVDNGFAEREHRLGKRGACQPQLRPISAIFCGSWCPLTVGNPTVWKGPIDFGAPRWGNLQRFSHGATTQAPSSRWADLLPFYQRGRFLTEALSGYGLSARGHFSQFHYTLQSEDREPSMGLKTHRRRRSKNRKPASARLVPPMSVPASPNVQNASPVASCKAPPSAGKEAMPT